MKICKIYIRDFQQFKDVELDFTHPETGEPLNKICFIGSNGTGKSKLLRLINWLFTSVFTNFGRIGFGTPHLVGGEAKVIFKIFNKNSNLLIFHFNRNSFILQITGMSKGEESHLIQELLSLKLVDDFTRSHKYDKLIQSTLSREFLNDLILKDNAKDLLIYSPSENEKIYLMGKDGVPKTNVNEALSLFNNFPFYAEVSPAKVEAFWKLLIYNLRKRAEERDRFENLPVNLKKTKDVLIQEFDSENPKILEHLAKVWNKILNKAGLEFDFEGASNPFQLNDNLLVYARLIYSKETIPYDELSSGVKNFIFRLGHIHSLYFNREIDRGFILIDEPENSLYPDFLFDLVEAYKEVLIDKRGQNNTQLFFVTHNPIIAAQFQPYERIILDFDEDGFVSARRGVSPVGDDPNDVLTNDFEMTDLMGPEGKKQWEKYIDLKKTLIKATDTDEKIKIAKEINQIGQSYNFQE